MSVTSFYLLSENKALFLTKPYMKLNGFTLLELLIVISILSILMFVGIPGLHTLQAQSSLDTNINLIRSVFFSARQLAVNQHKNMTVCFSTDNHRCIENPSRRLLMFHDKNNNHIFDEKQGDEVITTPNLNTSVLKIISNQPYFIYQSDGTLAGTPGSINICHSHLDTGKRIIFAMSGRMRTQSFDCTTH